MPFPECADGTREDHSFCLLTRDGTIQVMNRVGRTIAKWVALVAIVLQVVCAGAGRCVCRPAGLEGFASQAAVSCTCCWTSSVTGVPGDAGSRSVWVHEGRSCPAEPQPCRCPHDCCGRAAAAIAVFGETTPDPRSEPNAEPAFVSIPADARTIVLAFFDSRTTQLSDAPGAFRCILLCRFTI